MGTRDPENYFGVIRAGVYRGLAHRGNNLFKGYMYTFMRIKQKASGPPEWVKERDGHERYIGKYHEKVGILLEESKSESGHETDG